MSDETTVPIVLGTIRVDREEGKVLRSLTKAGTSENTTYPRLVRLYIKMGLALRKHGIYNVEQLEQRLSTLSKPELQELEDRIISRLEAQVLSKIDAAMKSSPRKK